MLNSIVLMGRLTADPEVKTTSNGTPVCSFSIAVDRDYSGSEEKKTDFINITTWRHTAEFISKYFKKGNMIALQGSLQSQKWEDKEGNSRLSWSVQASQVWFAGAKKTSSNSDKELNDVPDDLIDSDDDDDLPF